MNYESIANLVHDYVKNPVSMVTKENRLSEIGVKPSEFSVIKNVFSRHEISGGTVAIEVGSLALWE